MNEMHCKTITGDIVTSLRVQKHQEKQVLQLHFNKTGVKWNIQPKIKGIDLRPNGQVIVSTGEVLPKMTFVFTALASKENATLPFDIEVYGCEYGSFTKLKDGTVPIDLFHNSELVYSGVSHGVYLCIPHGDYTYRSPNSTATRFSVYDEDGTHFHTSVFNGFGEPIEGSFSNDFNTPMEISFPSTVSLLRGIEKRMLLHSRGPITNVTVQPPLLFNANLFQLTVMTRAEGVTTYTITANYGDRHAQTTFTVYCGSCPEGTTLVRTSMDMKALSYSLPAASPDLFTFSQSFCVAGESFDVHVYPYGEGSLFFYTGGQLLYEYRSVASNVTRVFSVQFRPYLQFASSLAFFVGEPPSRWNQPRFKDSKWLRASEGGWGAFDASGTACFRGGFTVDDPYRYAFFLLHLRGEGDAEVFVDGSLFSRASLRNDSATVVIPSSSLKKGQNVVAVRLRDSSVLPTADDYSVHPSTLDSPVFPSHFITSPLEGNSTIRFAMALDATNTPRLPMLDGEASAEQASPDPKHPPEKAFALLSCADSAWTGTFPAELAFNFTHAQQLINLVQMRLPHGRYTLEIVGANDADRTTLGRFNGDNIAELRRGVAFASTRAFQSVHFFFNSSQAGAPFSVSCVRLYSHTSFPCPWKPGCGRSVEGAVAVKGCPLGSTGRRRLTCVRESGGPYWADDRSQCFATNPVKGMVYIDWSFTISNMTEEEWGGRKSELAALLAESMYLKAETVQYLYEDFWADGETTVMKGFSRCCVKSVYGEALEYDFHEMMARFGEVVGKMGAYSGSIDKVTLRRHVNWALVISVSVLTIIVVLLAAVYFASRARKGNKKRLLRKGSGEHVSLL
ncbi:hypothetical protein AV274_2045 [Blastocystis sp. ATCC 50177/Nand II]|uniref:Uncharacterized protein n=1 Tax=Blastocystis sp. subtype 1 (strain ATCC 50177 / NandII) TaxID=478820 RepID=A0A196SGN4_BLAHN|nr:hypothetical protein AV274_2045 [Blastocystis sp. ATCC 50177/Nand II]